MAKPLNPLFPDFDMTKMFGQFDPAKTAADMQKMMEQYKLPMVDMEAVLTAQRKNVEALTAANRLAFESLQAAMKRQSEILRAAMEELAETTSRLSGGQAQPADLPDVVKVAFERAITNMREIAEMAAKSNTEVMDVLNTRFTAMLDETKAMIAQVEAAAPAAPAAAKPAAAKAAPKAATPAA